MHVWTRKRKGWPKVGNFVDIHLAFKLINPVPRNYKGQIIIHVYFLTFDDLYPFQVHMSASNVAFCTVKFDRVRMENNIISNAPHEIQRCDLMFLLPKACGFSSLFRHT